MKVGVENGDTLDLVPAKRPITIQDLMRHTSGLTYGFTGATPVQKLTHAADLMSQARTTAEHMEILASLPLQHQPGEVWEYSLSTDVLGRVVEIVAGRSLGEFLRERIFAPLGMGDTAFYAPDSKRERLAQPFSFDFLTAAKVDPIEAQRAAALRIGRRRPSLDDRRLRALSGDVAAAAARSTARAFSARGPSPSWRATTWGRTSSRTIPCCGPGTVSGSASRCAPSPASRRRRAPSANISGAAWRAPCSGFRRATRCSRS